MNKIIDDVLRESFSFGHGNNDYLSDIGDVEVKDKLSATAFIPDDVGMRMGLVNEMSKEKKQKIKNYLQELKKLTDDLNEVSFGGGNIHTTDDLVGDVSKPAHRDDIANIDEREKKYMPGSIGVDVKKQCRLGGLNGTSKACNQGEIQNLNLTKINESEGGISKLSDLPFRNDVMALGGEIYSVGGAVRDELIGKESKDLDILITGVPLDDLEKIMQEYGKVDAVGKSFGVLKFKPHGSKEEIDVTIPRTEKPTGEGGYGGFDVQSDHTLSIEDDLRRRDLTINAIAKDIHGNYVDPYGGIKDLRSGKIREVNSDAFSDDPLRMLRSIQFAARFEFKIDDETYKKIIDNSKRIREISPERIIIELEKIVTKGRPDIGAYHLVNTNMCNHIFNLRCDYDNSLPWSNVRNLGEFIFLLLFNVDRPSEIYKKRLQEGKSDVYKFLSALELTKSVSNSKPKNRFIAYHMYNIYKSDEILKSNILPPRIKLAANELLSPAYPKRIKDLEIDGNELINLGFKRDKNLGEMLNHLLKMVYDDEVNNRKQDLLDHIKKYKKH